MTTVADLMTREIQTCRPGDALSQAAHILWERDCGSLPVVDDQGRPVGMLTDRDICMAALTRGGRLHELGVAATLSGRVHTVSETDGPERAHEVMRTQQVRRLPVVDASGRLTGLLSLCDLVRRALTVGGTSARQQACEEAGLTLAAITRAHDTPWEESGTKAARKPTASGSVAGAVTVGTPAAVATTVGAPQKPGQPSSSKSTPSAAPKPVAVTPPRGSPPSTRPGNVPGKGDSTRTS